MIPTSTRTMPTDAIQSGTAALPNASKKKHSPSSLFAALVESARNPKGGASSSLAPSPGEKTDRLSPLKRHSLSASDATKEGKPSPLKSQIETAAQTSRLSLRADSKGRLPGLDAESDGERNAAELASRAETKASVRGRKGRIGENADPIEGGAAASSVVALHGQHGVRKPFVASDASATSESRVEGADGGKNRKKKNRLEIDVYDRRREEASNGTSGVRNSTEAVSERSLDRSSENVSDLTIRLHDGSKEGDRDPRCPSLTENGRTSFADALARELRETAGGDIVRQASVVLKDGGEGLIRLSLRPESLGSVKIKLELAENKIAGRIVVETEEALKAFGKELRSLEQAFLDGGFDGASLELALSSGDAGAGAGNRDRTDGPAPFFSERLIAAEYDSSVPEAAAQRSFAGREDALIDVLA